MLYRLLPVVVGWVLDHLLGDPSRWPHPVVLFGKVIALCERHWNKGSHRRRLLSGTLCSVALVVMVYAATAALLSVMLSVSEYLSLLLSAVLVFYCLAGTTLVREVKAVFAATERSVGEGRQQVARIVGRDTSRLTADEVRTAALETLAENLSDGVIAPLFWLAVLGVPGMMAYKMVNTLDSMIGYRTERFAAFGRVAARMDDVANFIPARLTAVIMTIVGRGSFAFVRRYGRCHASPNSGWPEAALASILDCRFGGTHDYFGVAFYKPYIGDNARPLTATDLSVSVRVCRIVEGVMVVMTLCCRALLAPWW